MPKTFARNRSSEMHSLSLETMAEHNGHAVYFPPQLSRYPRQNTQQSVRTGLERNKAMQMLKAHGITSKNLFHPTRFRFQQPSPHNQPALRQVSGTRSYQNAFRLNMATNGQSNSHQDRSSNGNTSIGEKVEWDQRDQFGFCDELTMFPNNSSPAVNPLASEMCQFRPADQYFRQFYQRSLDDTQADRDVPFANDDVATSSSVLQKQAKPLHCKCTQCEDMSRDYPTYAGTVGGHGNRNSPSSPINTSDPFTPGNRVPNERSLSAANGTCFTAYPKNAGSLMNGCVDYEPSVITSLGEHHPLSAFSSSFASSTSSLYGQDYLFGMPPTAGLGITVGPNYAVPAFATNDPQVLTTSFQPGSGEKPDVGHTSILPSATLYHPDEPNVEVQGSGRFSFSSGSEGATNTTDEDDRDTYDSGEDNRARDEARAVRQRRDLRLLELRRQGMSYKKIKKVGNFREAESTLRGRVRNLTKDKTERVRKPEWTAADVNLLHQAVAFHSPPHKIDGYNKLSEPKGKLPWKAISLSIKEHGGSYPFAAVTCSRKWEELRNAR